MNTPTAADFDERMTDCPFCRSDRIMRHDTDYTGRTIDRCASCGAMFLNPQYSDRYLDDFYKHYVGAADLADTKAAVANEPIRHVVHGHYMELIERCIGKGRMLSVGCGDGLELAVALERGWAAEGFDVDPKATSAISEQLGIEVRHGDFRKVAYPPNSFDCVYLHQVLEHPKNARDYLTKIHEILRPGGILFVASPNIGSFVNRLKSVSGRLHLKKRRGRHYDTWHHIFYYSPASLRRILERHFGYEVVLVRNGFGHKVRARGFSIGRIKREMWWNRFLPCWKDVFIILAEKGSVPFSGLAAADCPE
jgi:SAM-dependent methyltransferase